MAIKGLGFDMMSAYNRIGVNDRTDSIQAVRESAKASEAKPVQADSQNASSGVKVNLNFDSITRRPGASFDNAQGTRGRSSFSLAVDEQSMKSDMDKAVAAMEMDSSLKQYQYFVGGSNIITNDEDGLVFIK